MLFKIFDAEFEADMLDYDYMVMVENELANVEKNTREVKARADLGEMTQSTLIKDLCEVIFRFFDTVFGDGATQKIFKGKINYKDALTAFGEYVLQKNEHSSDDVKDIDKEYMLKIQNSVVVQKDGKKSGNKPANVQQYNGNRAQRRNAQKKKGKNIPNRYHK